MKKKATVEMTDEAILKEARENFKLCEDRESDNRSRMKEAMLFVAGEQWPSELKRYRENPHKQGGAQACPVFDITRQYIQQIVNEERINTPSLKFRPVDDVADPEVAEVYNGLARHIQDNSVAVSAYTKSGEHAVIGGFGYFRMMTDYCDSLSFDQDILIRAVDNPMMVYLGPHTDATGADARYAFVFEDIPSERFKRDYPDAQPDDWEGSEKSAEGWYTKETVRIAEYYCIKETKADIVQLTDGSVMHKSEYEAQAKAAQAAIVQGSAVDVPQIIGERETRISKVHWYKLTGSKIIDHREILGTMIPVFQVVGERMTMPDGAVRLSGKVESGMDPQRLHNYAHAKFIEQVALAPSAPWVGPVGFMSGKENQWQDANKGGTVALEYTAQYADNGQVLPGPERASMPGIPAGWQQLLINTANGVEKAFGMYGASIGGPARERSGVALEEQKQQGQIGNMHYQDNLARAIQQCGRVMLEWIPSVYDTERAARILGDDGSVETAYLNPEQDKAVMDRTDALGQVVGKSYNLSIGKYDVTVSTGPSFATKRQEAAAQMTEVLKSKPELMQIIGDLVFKNMDWPGADQIAERLKTMLPPQIQQLEASKDKKPIDPKVRAIMAQVEMMGQQIEAKRQELAEIETQLKQEGAKVGADKAAVNAELTKLQSERKVFDARVAEQMANLELEKHKILAAIEEAQEPEQEIGAASEAPQKVNGHTIMMQDPMMTQVIANLGESMQGAFQQINAANIAAQQELGANMSTAISAIAESMNRPRRVIPERDKNGDIVGGTSVPM